MKYLILLFLLFSGPAIAGDATFTWVKPIPAFDPPVPAGWTIDEYRIYCAVDGGESSLAATVLGYSTESYTLTDMPVGNTACFMTSFSVGSGTESLPSNTVTKMIYEASSPNGPAFFDFAPAIE